MSSFPVNLFGGLNSYDQENTLVNRAYQFSENGAQQHAPLESVSIQNIDYAIHGIKSRLGSEENADLISTMNDTLDRLLSGYNFKIASTDAFINIIVSIKSIYYSTGSDDAATWAKFTTRSGATYNHAADVSKCTFTETDGHLFIGLDGSNAIQVYKEGTILEDQFHNNDTASAVDQASSGTTLYVSSTTAFKVHDRIRIASGQAKDEVAFVTAITAGDSLTLYSALANSFTSASAAAVIVENKYIYSFGANTQNAITGTIDTGQYLVTSMHGRLIYSDGNTVVNHTPAADISGSGLWDYAGSTAGFYQAGGKIVMLAVFTPQYDNSLAETLYIGSTAGLEIVSGFDSTDFVNRIAGAKPAYNHHAYCKSKNWLIYLTADKNILGVNGNHIINLGRRARNPDLITGELDSLVNIGQTGQTKSFAFYNEKKEQAYFFITQSTLIVNNTCVIIDFKLGEPILNEPEQSFERHVRLLPWKLQASSVTATNNYDWFIGMIQTRENVLGILPRGTVCKTEYRNADIMIRLKNSLTNIAISAITLVDSSPVKITTTAIHNLVTGDIVLFKSVGGTTELNLNKYVVTVISTTIFTLDNTTYTSVSANYTAWTSGGEIYQGKKIDARWKSPPYYGEIPTRIKQWGKIMIRSIPQGNWPVTVNFYKNRDSSSTKTIELAQVEDTTLIFDVAIFDDSVFSDGGIVRASNRVNIRSEIIQVEFTTTDVLQPFEITNYQQDYYIGSQIN